MIVIIAAIIIITNTDDFRNLQCGLKIVAKTKSDKTVMEMKQTIL